MDCHSQGCQSPTSSNIENNIGREGMIDVIITPNYSDCHKFACTKTNQIIMLQRHARVDEEKFDVNIKRAPTMQSS